LSVLLPWLFVTAALGQSDLGLLGVIITVVGFLGFALALVAAIRKPSWPLLWLLLPLTVPHVFLQVVGVWLIGDHHETVSLSLYAAALLAALVITVYAARANPLAVTGAVVFALTYALIAFEASLFVFWNGLH
jgi:hypothetical membrane protein